MSKKSSVLALAENRMVVPVEKEDLLRLVSRELRAASRTQRERQERERIEQAATPTITLKQIKTKIGSSRKTRKGYIRAMQTLGLRELKNRLSQYIRRVRDGQLVIVTDRGQVVAELRPPGEIPAACKIDP